MLLVDLFAKLYKAKIVSTLNSLNRQIHPFILIVFLYYLIAMNGTLIFEIFENKSYIRFDNYVFN